MSRNLKRFKALTIVQNCAYVQGQSFRDSRPVRPGSDPLAPLTLAGLFFSRLWKNRVEFDDLFKTACIKNSLAQHHVGEPFAKLVFLVQL